MNFKVSLFHLLVFSLFSTLLFCRCSDKTTKQGIGQLPRLKENKTRPPNYETKKIKIHPPLIVHFIEGNVKLQRKTEELSISPGIELHTKDVLTTDKKSFFILKWGDLGLFKIAPQSQIQIDDLLPSKSTKKISFDEHKFHFYLPFGAIYTDINFENKEQELAFGIITKRGFIQAQATKFLVSVVKSDQMVRLATLSGESTIEAFSQKKILTVKSGQGVSINGNNEVQRPGTHPWVASIPWKEVLSGTDTQSNEELDEYLSDLNQLKKKYKQEKVAKAEEQYNKFKKLHHDLNKRSEKESRKDGKNEKAKNIKSGIVTPVNNLLNLDQVQNQMNQYHQNTKKSFEIE